MLKKGCAIAAVAILGTFAAYYAFLKGKVESPGDLILAIFGSIGLLLLLSTLKQVIFGSGDADAMDRAEKKLPLRDGKREAVWGPIYPMGSPLESPFGGRPCVAYEYDAKHAPSVNDEGEESSAGSAITGVALTPSFIRSERGDVRLLGMGLLEKFPATKVPREEAHARALAWLARTNFTESGLSKIASLVSQMDGVLADSDGTVRQDWKMGSVDAGELARCTLEEKVIAPGTTVTAVGLWDASQAAIVPVHPGGARTIVTLAPGGGAAMVALSKERPWGLLAFAIVWAGAAHAFIYFALRFGGR